MDTHIVNVYGSASPEQQDRIDGGNWGTFLLARLTKEERLAREPTTGSRLFEFQSRHLSDSHVLVLDLATKEGVVLDPEGPLPLQSQIRRHQVWGCILYAPFVEWLLKQNLTGRIKDLPTKVCLPGVEFLQVSCRANVVPHLQPEVLQAMRVLAELGRLHPQMVRTLSVLFPGVLVRP